MKIQETKGRGGRKKESRKREKGGGGLGGVWGGGGLTCVGYLFSDRFDVFGGVRNYAERRRGREGEGREKGGSPVLCGPRHRFYHRVSIGSKK